MLPVEVRGPDGALTVHHDGTFASLRVVTIAEDLEMVSLTQILAWDLPLNAKIRDKVSSQARARCSDRVLVENGRRRGRAAWPGKGRPPQRAM